MNGDNISVRDETIPLTVGLLNLLFLKDPIHYNQDDLNNFKAIIEIINLHKKFNQTNSAKRTHKKNEKFINIIERLFKKSGNGIHLNLMELNEDAKTEFKFWDNANELVDRLKLLIASHEAGHTGHNDEIISIIEELREANLFV